MLDNVLMIVYIVMLCAGGVMGWLKAGSKISLITSLISAALVVLGLVLLKNQPRIGYGLVALVGLILTITFIIRYAKTHHPMPAIPILVLSIPVFVLCLYRILNLR